MAPPAETATGRLLHLTAGVVRVFDRPDGQRPPAAVHWYDPEDDACPRPTGMCPGLGS